MATYMVMERGPHWIVSTDGREVTRYRKDEIAWNGATDIAEMKREIRQGLNLGRSDHVVVED